MTFKEAKEKSIDKWNSIIKSFVDRETLSTLRMFGDCGICFYMDNIDGDCYNCPIERDYGRCANNPTFNELEDIACGEDASDERILELMYTILNMAKDITLRPRTENKEK